MQLKMVTSNVSTTQWLLASSHETMRPPLLALTVAVPSVLSRHLLGAVAD